MRHERQEGFKLVKQVIVLRTDLNMRKGKMVAQGAHASLLAILGDGSDVGGEHHLLNLDPSLLQWLHGDYRKICVGVGSEADLLETHSKALAAGLRCSLVKDMGHTEFGGIPTFTAVAIGPAASQLVDAITGTFKLL